MAFQTVPMVFECTNRWFSVIISLSLCQSNERVKMTNYACTIMHLYKISLALVYVYEILNFLSCCGEKREVLHRQPTFAVYIWIFPCCWLYIKCRKLNFAIIFYKSSSQSAFNCKETCLAEPLLLSATNSFDQGHFYE